MMMRPSLTPANATRSTGAKRSRNGLQSRLRPAPSTELRACEKRDGQWIVDTVMTGDFKASPARFMYTITIRGEKISALRVEFLGSLIQTL
jgi:hypothetical protein